MKNELEIGGIKDIKIDVLTMALIKELQSPEFQNEYTFLRKSATLRVFADLIEQICKE